MSTPEQPTSEPTPAASAAAAPRSAPRGSGSHLKYAGKSGVSKLWVAGALVVGLAVGAAGAVAVGVLTKSNTQALPAEPNVVSLSSTNWFAEGDELPTGAVAPGADIVLGKSATVLVGSVSGGQSVAKITVTAVAAFDAKDDELLKSAQPALAGQRLYRIDYTVEYVSGDPLAGMRIGDAIYPVDAEGAPLLRVPVSGWKKCGEAALPTTVDESADGATPVEPAAMCAVAASPDGGADVVGAQFAQAGGPYSIESTGQITWLPAAN